METPLYRHVTQVAFGDTDASGLIHFPNVFHYVEAAEHAFLRELKIPIFSREEGGWPRVHVDCDYRHMLFFGDSIEVQLGISNVGETSLTWIFEIHKSGQLCASGSMVTVRVDGAGSPLPIDSATRQALQA